MMPSNSARTALNLNSYTLVFNESPVAQNMFIETSRENYHDEDNRSEKNQPHLQPFNGQD